MRRLPPLSALRAFEAAARHGSFKLAAHELSVTPTAISHQIRLLEQFAGLALFERQVRKVTLTADGSALYPVLRDGFNAFEAAFSHLGARQERRKVTISATNAFTAKWLAPRVAGFSRLHPDLDLQLHASDDAVDFADIAIRYGRGPYPGAVAESLFADCFAPVASPGLGEITIDNMESIGLIEFAWKTAHPLNPTWEKWYAEAGLQRRAPHGRLRFSDEGHAIQAAISGQGIALLSLALVAEEIASGQLIQPFRPTLTGHRYHLVRSAGHAEEAPVIAAANWLREETKLLRCGQATGVSVDDLPALSTAIP